MQKDGKAELHGKMVISLSVIKRLNIMGLFSLLLALYTRIFTTFANNLIVFTKSITTELKRCSPRYLSGDSLFMVHKLFPSIANPINFMD